MSALPVVITKSELKDLMAHGSFTLIDVREKSETDLGRIPGAKLAPGTAVELVPQNTFLTYIML